MSSQDRPSISSALEASTEFQAGNIVKGHALAWGGSARLYPVRPYTLTPGALEAFTVRERIHARIDGLGEDVVDLNGMAIYHRNHPYVEDAAQPLGWGTATVTAQFLSLQVIGVSDVFGQVQVTNSPGKVEGATVRPSVSMPSRSGCVTAIFPVFSIQRLGAVLNTGEKIVQLRSNIAMIPPIGDVSRTHESYALYDGSGRRAGELLAADIEIGALLHYVPIDLDTDQVPAVPATD